MKELLKEQIHSLNRAFCVVDINVPKELKKHKSRLADMDLFKTSRLSVQRVPKHCFEFMYSAILHLKVWHCFELQCVFVCACSRICIRW